MNTINVIIKNVKYFLPILGIFISCLIGLVITILILSNLQPSIKTPPVSKVDVNLLCKNLKIQEEEICTRNENSYPYDFSSYISNRFEVSPVTYQEVQNSIAEFQMSLDVNQDLNVFVSYYDLNRDGKVDFSIYFEGTLENNILDAILFREETSF